MVLEEQILPYLQWLLGTDETNGALPNFLFVACVLAVLVIVVGYLLSAARHGIVNGGDRVYHVISQGFIELLSTSPRRVWAMAVLAIKDARRRRVEVALVIFLIILAFANWFLGTDNQNPARLYFSFVLSTTTYLVLGISLLLSTLSLPTDFKNKTIYTVVTKPVYATEIVLGRILGFSIVGTILLSIVAVASYLFIIGSLSHTHEVDKRSLSNVKSRNEVIGKRGTTFSEADHVHEVELYPDNSGKALTNYDHYHVITSDGSDIVVEDAEGIIRARLPKYGKLSFLDRQGSEVQRGINVGNEWDYRSFIEGNTQAAAYWNFEGVDESFADEEGGLPIGLLVRVFRTHKGIIGKPITGGIIVRNFDSSDPNKSVISELIPFAAQDNKVEEFSIPRKLRVLKKKDEKKATDKDGEVRDLFEDFVTPTGELEIRVVCLERGQYFGFAQPDCYLRQPEASPLVNFVKIYVSIWVQMVIVIAIGVVSSTVISGPVAMVFTASFILLGFFRDFFVGIAAGPDFARYGVEKVYGGGPVEAFYRIVTQMNVMSPLPEGWDTSLILGIDAVLRRCMLSVAQVLPDFSSFSTISHAAYGYNVPPEKVGADLTTCLAYVLGLTIVGYFLLRTREVAK